MMKKYIGSIAGIWTILLGKMIHIVDYSVENNASLMDRSGEMDS